MKHGCRIEIWHKRTVWTALVMLIASFFIFPGCALLPKEEKPLPPPLIKPVKVEYTTVDVKKQTLTEKIQGGAAFIYEKRSTILSKGTGNRLKALYIKLGNKVKVGDLIAEMDNDGILEEINYAKAELKKAEIRLTIAKEENAARNAEPSETKLALDRANAELEIQEIDVQIMKEKLESINKKYKNTRLISTAGGDVTYVLNAKEGDVIDPYTAVAEIADPSKLILDWQYTDDVNRLRISNGMQVTVDIAGDRYKGSVVATPSDFQEKDRVKYQNTIRIKVENLPVKVRAGDLATVFITLQERKDVLVVPANAVRVRSAVKYVLILKDGIKKEQEVELGLLTNNEVEVIKGLKIGDKVILR